MTVEPSRATAAVLEVRGLRVSYRGKTGPVPAVSGVDFSVGPGEVVAIVGESGSGKSTTALAAARLLPAGARIDGGEIRFRGEDLVRLPEKELRRLRGRAIGFVPQDPAVSLNPVRRVGDQIAEVLRIHGTARGDEARDLAVEALIRAGCPIPGSGRPSIPTSCPGACGSGR